jgi:transcriptional regulator with XRE-family HTH domain
MAALYFLSRPMERITEQILTKLREKRREKKVSVLNLALEVGISHSHLYYIESKKVVPSVDVLVKISRALEVPLEDLVK